MSKEREERLMEVQYSTASSLNWLGGCIRCCSCCGILAGLLTLFCNAMWVTELEMGDPDKDVKVINAQVSKVANNFLDSKFYQGVNNGTLLPNYKAYAIDLYSLPKIVSIDKVTFPRDVAMFLVQTWFIVSVLNLCINCFCMDITKPAFDV